MQVQIAEAATRSVATGLLGLGRHRAYILNGVRHCVPGAGWELDAAN